MDNYAQKVEVVNVQSEKSLDSKKENLSLAQHSTSLVMSAVSEPEDGLIRQFFIETTETGFIRNLVIKDSDGHVVRHNLNKLLESEVTVAKVKGIDAVMMQILAVTGDEGIIRVRYLSRAPSQYLNFELRARKQPNGQWAMFEKDRPRMFKWMLFRSKTFMGVTVGVDSYELSQEKPNI
jgi:hypothetical protein